MKTKAIEKGIDFISRKLAKTEMLQEDDRYALPNEMEAELTVLEAENAGLREALEFCSAHLTNDPLAAHERIRAALSATPDSGKVIDATVYYSGKYGAHKPVVVLTGQESLKTAGARGLTSRTTQGGVMDRERFEESLRKGTDELDLFLSEILGCNDPRATARKQPLLKPGYFAPIDELV